MEVKVVHQSVRVVAVDLAAGLVEIVNRYDFSTLSHLSIHWKLEEDGELLQAGELAPLDLGPGCARVVQVPIAPPKVEPGAEYWLTLSFRLAGDTAWARAGHEVAWEQFRLPYEAPAAPGLPVEQMPALRLATSEAAIQVQGADFSLAFDRATGMITSWRHGGRELLARGPLFNAWRAPTENDAGMRQQQAERRWREAGLDRLAHRLRELRVEQVADQVVRVYVRCFASPPERTVGFRYVHTYTLYGSGDLLIDTEVEPGYRLPTLPRVGLQMRLPGGYDTFTWYGRGPHESYADRQVGAAVGLYSGTVDQQYVPYVVPQENGNKTDVRWVALTDGEGCGLLAVGLPLLEVSAHHYTTEDLAQARHTHELTRRDEITLNLDYRQSGLGGESCGPGTLPQYLIQPDPMRLRLRLRPLDGERSPRALSRQVLAEG